MEPRRPSPATPAVTSKASATPRAPPLRRRKKAVRPRFGIKETDVPADTDSDKPVPVGV